LPIYYVNCPILSDDARRAGDELAEIIAARQFIDWRELRFEPFTSPLVLKRIAELAAHIAEALQQTLPDSRPVQPRGRAPATGAEAPATRVGAEADSGRMAETGIGPVAKSEPRTLVVDAMHRGDHATLTAALNAAEAGDRILVLPGLYREGIVIDKPVEIVGDGELGDAIIEASGSAVVLFKTTMGRIANLVLRQSGGAGQWFCVDIVQGRLDLEDCDITSQSLSCVAIHGGADPRLRRNRIHDGGGVHVYENGQGTLEDNDIFAITLAGVEIKDGSNPTLRRNRIHDGKSTGAHVHSNGQGTLEDSEISGNAEAGVTVWGEANPVFRRNTITKNKLEAVWICQGGRGVFEDNDLRGNVRGTWNLAPDCAANVVRKNNQE
jgi:parallel beta-helix repeat protein